MKRIALLVLMVALGAVLVLGGCGSSEFSLVVDVDNTAVITLADSDEGDTGTAGTITLEEGDTLYIEPALEDGGTVNIKFIPAPDEGEDAAVEDLMDSVDPANAVMDVDVESSEAVECGLPAGDYVICATVTGKGSGTILIRVGEKANPWTAAATAEEAAAGAGLDVFEVPDGVNTGLGPVAPLSFGYREGVAEADISAGAVEMRARKGLTSVYEDVSFDENAYNYEWSREIGSTVVKCCGNRALIHFSVRLVCISLLCDDINKALQLSALFDRKLERSDLDTETVPEFAGDLLIVSVCIIHS